MIKKNYKIHLNDISAFIFDVDGVLTDGRVIVTSEGEMYRQMDTKDGFAIKQALKRGFKIGIISGGTNEGVRKRLELLGVNKVYLGENEKISAFEDFLAQYNIDAEQVLYMGDDIPDIPVMKLAGVSTCPSDSATDVKQLADYISHKKGGKGCVREIIEQVLRVQSKWDFSFKKN